MSILISVFISTLIGLQIVTTVILRKTIKFARNNFNATKDKINSGAVFEASNVIYVPLGDECGVAYHRNSGDVSFHQDKHCVGGLWNYKLFKLNPFVYYYFKKYKKLFTPVIEKSHETNVTNKETV